jgi:membrane protein
MLFAIIYKVLPDRKIHWIDVVLSAVVTGVAFTVTNYVIGAYVQTFTVTTFIGAAGALFVILLWIYIINLIVLFGAEVSKVYAQTYGPHPQEHMIPVAEMKFLQSLEGVGERIEEVTKGSLDETSAGTIVGAESQKETDPEIEKKKN